MHIAQEDEEEESSLLMVLADEHVDVLLQRMNSSLITCIYNLNSYPI